MVKIIFRLSVFFILIIFLASFISAFFSLGNASDNLATSYAPKMNLTGWINLSLDRELANSIFEDSFGNEIKLIDLIKLNSAFIYECVPSSCEANYVASDGDTTQSLDLEEDGEGLFGMKITAENQVGDISHFYFDISSNNGESEKNPLSIDILNDGQIEWEAYSPSENFGNPNYGCFTGVNTHTELIATTPPYCERITLKKTPQVEIGAYVNYEKGTGSVNFEMSIQDSDGNKAKKTCSTAISGEGIQRVACTPEFVVDKEGDYFVCVRNMKTVDNGKYKINAEQKEPCGFTGEFEGDYEYDFEIFARPKKYAASISATINDDELENADSPILNLEDYIDYYLNKNYGKDCKKGCVIPIKIYSGVDQQIEISNAFVDFIADTYQTENEVYKITESPTEISTTELHPYQKISLDKANFSVPSAYGNYSVSFRLDDVFLMSKKISVAKTAQIKTLGPTKTAVKYPTRFIVEVSGGNATSYSWEFGDGTVQSTSVGNAVHTYNSLGSYQLKISVQTDRGIAEKNFSITVGSASEVVPSLLNQADSNLANIKLQMKELSQFEQESVNETLNLSSAEKSIMKMKDSLLSAVTEEDYGKILSELIEINLPITIAKTTSTQGLNFFPKEDAINLEIIQEIGGGSYTAKEEEKYKQAILGWQERNVNSSLRYSEISLIYEDREELLKTFNISLTNKGVDESYIVIKKLPGLVLENKDSYTEKSGYFYTSLTNKKNVRFSTTEEIDFTNVPMFISPKLTSLVISSISLPKKINWGIPVGIAIGILLFGLMLWIILQIWYIRKYENYLFKDRNQLYNLVRYIDDSKKKGENDNEISSKLKKSGWNSEQLRYALRKYEMKNTGLPEIIPLKKIFGEFRKTARK